MENWKLNLERRLSDLEKQNVTLENERRLREYLDENSIPQPEFVHQRSLYGINMTLKYKVGKWIDMVPIVSCFQWVPLFTFKKSGFAKSISHTGFHDNPGKETWESEDDCCPAWMNINHYDSYFQFVADVFGNKCTILIELPKYNKQFQSNATAHTHRGHLLRYSNKYLTLSKKLQFIDLGEGVIAEAQVQQTWSSETSTGNFAIYWYPYTAQIITPLDIVGCGIY